MIGFGAFESIKLWGYIAAGALLLGSFGGAVWYVWDSERTKSLLETDLTLMTLAFEEMTAGFEGCRKAQAAAGAQGEANLTACERRVQALLKINQELGEVELVCPEGEDGVVKNTSGTVRALNSLLAQ